jgi:two-component system CheB/CheR fusion protein
MAHKARKPRKPGKPPASPVQADPLADPVADQTKPDLPIVGIGASAGGLAAFEAFFSGMPVDRDPGMAFILVQHLDPKHKSLLVELVKHFTRMAVYEIEDGMTVKPNCVYIIPPNHDLAILNGTLQLLRQTAPRGHHLPIDFFFNALAEDQRKQAIAIVLSGTGSDGSQGLRAIKAAGGLVLAQHPGSCEFDGMPRSALATGLVDFELPPAEMPARLITYAAEACSRPAGPVLAQIPTTENALKKIFVLLRAQTKHDFSHYKLGTVNRRLERRMAVHKIEKLDDYVQFLQVTPAEVEELFHDLLIGVTNFFRDPSAFAVLETQTIPELCAGKNPGSIIRVWSAGCSTGEEAYSLAILLLECTERLKQGHIIQIFATDIDSRAIATARAGRYPASITADLSPERLARFFVREPDGLSYRVHKTIRDLVVFSEQDLIKDPPFSRLDLVSCRNLLIYFDAELQKKLIPLFHYALNPGGRLFLGTSEGVGDFDELFVVQDRAAKIYQRKDASYGLQRLTLDTTIAPPPMTAIQAALPRLASKLGNPLKIPLRELTEQTLLQHVGMVGVLVNATGDILYQHGRAGMYLEPAPGEAGVSNMVKMAREGLRPDLVTALHQVAVTHDAVRRPNVRVKTNGHFTTITLTVRPVSARPTATPGTQLYVVIIDEAEPASPTMATSTPLSSDTPGDHPGLDAEARIAALIDEMRRKDEFVRATQEELEASSEELKSANEEMQSVNEELQSTNEELETSKEEQQSVNEELATVNAELHGKIIDLSRTNDDMSNMLAGTGIATVFADLRLRILRFTPTASLIINLIPSDVGRPVAHTVSNLVGYDRLVSDAQMVLDTLIPKEVEVQTLAGQWYMMRIQPYRTQENQIVGAVLTFVDVTETKLAQAALLKANDLLRLAVVVRDAHDAITVQDLAGQILAWNPGAVRMYGWSEAEALHMNTRERIPPALRKDALVKMHDLSLAGTLAPYHTQRLTKTGAVVEIAMISTALINVTGEVYAISTTERLAKPDDQPT